MVFESGARLGRYEIRSLLGAGGMGQVYRAKDPKLARDVAIKVLPVEFSSDADRMRRFEQEAQATGALNHPNILAVYDISIEGDTTFLVSELLEGETLRSRMRAQHLPARKTIEYALQVARGLAAAHQRGIIHRDLKPENVFITLDGRVKILDFGLAKLTSPLQEGNNLDLASTHSVLTTPGIALGTMAYMSPEQLRGKPVDHRSDIFSLGTMLYEMLTGKHPFFQGSTADTIQAILRDDPPPIPDTTVVAAPYERVVRRCLEKDPSERFQSAGDLAFALEAMSGISATHEPSSGVVASSRKSVRTIAWLAAIPAAILLLLAFFMLRSPGTQNDSRLIQFPVSLPQNVIFTYDVETHNVTISPDGRHIALVASERGERSLWLRSLGQLESKKLRGTEGALSPFWSPDSRFIAFFAEQKLKKVNTSGGVPQTVCSLASKWDHFGAWGTDGNILFAQEGSRKIFRVSSSGGETSIAREFDNFWFYWLDFLPDGKHVVVTGTRNKTDIEGIFVLSIDSSEMKLISPARSRAEYAPPGFLFYSNEGSLLAHPFDSENLRLSGEAQVIVEPFSTFDKTGWAEFSVSDTGTLTYLNNAFKTQLVWLDRNGRDLGNLTGADLYRGLELAPDEKRIALEVSDPRTLSGDVWIHDVMRQTNTRLGFDSTDDGGVIWSPDGSRVAFFSCCEHESTLYIRGLNDSGRGSLPLQPGFQAPLDWSSNGKFILYWQDMDLWVLPLDANKKPFPLTKTPFKEDNAKFSPDDQWVAYISNELGQDDLYVARFNNPGEKWRISTAGGTYPRWRADGKELYYVSADWKMMAVPIQPGSSFEPGNAVTLFRMNSLSQYDVTADGQRFLVNSLPAATQSLPLNVILNWSSLIKK